MPTFGSLQARVIVDGVKLPEFDVRETFHDEDIKTIECWVESQPGQDFELHFLDTRKQTRPATKWLVRVDGAKVGNRIVRPERGPIGATEKNSVALVSVQTASGRRKLKFSAVDENLDDLHRAGESINAPLPTPPETQSSSSATPTTIPSASQSSTKKVSRKGEIDVLVYLAQITRFGPSATPAPSLSQRSSLEFGSQSSRAEPMVVEAHTIGAPIVNFIFRYRPLSTLDALGKTADAAAAMVPPTPPSSQPTRKYATPTPAKKPKPSVASMASRKPALGALNLSSYKGGGPVQTLLNFDNHKKDGDKVKGKGKGKEKERAIEPETIVKSEKPVKSEATDPAPKPKVILTPPASQEVAVKLELDPIGRRPQAVPSLEIIDDPRVKMEKTESAQPSREVAIKLERNLVAPTSTRPPIEPVAVKEEKVAKTEDMQPALTSKVPLTPPTSQVVTAKLERGPPATTRRQLRPDPSVIIMDEAPIKSERTEPAHPAPEAAVKLERGLPTSASYLPPVGSSVVVKNERKEKDEEIAVTRKPDVLLTPPASQQIVKVERDQPTTPNKRPRPQAEPSVEIIDGGEDDPEIEVIEGPILSSKRRRPGRHVTPPSLATMDGLSRTTRPLRVGNLPVEAADVIDLSMDD